MLACSKIPDLNSISYPKYASIKLDGIRCIIKDGKCLSRSLKPIPNIHVQRTLYDSGLEGLDGELMVKGDFNSVQSAVMSVYGEPDFTYHVFDYVDTTRVFEKRFDTVINKVLGTRLGGIVRIHEQIIVNNPDEANAAYSRALELGQEGLILKSINGMYKYGRATMREETMLKLKPKHTDEGLVIGYSELMHNDNDQYTNEVGSSVRSSCQSGQVPGNVLGALTLKFNDVVLSVGSGFDDHQRQSLWSCKEELIGKLVTFEHLGLSSYNVPRCPIFKSFRDIRDL